MRLAHIICERASRSEPSRTTAGSASAASRVASSPTAFPIGVRASTTTAAIACASASMPECAVGAVRRLLAETGFPTLRSIGVSEADLDELADAALADYFISVAPEPWTKQDVIAAYRAALDLDAR